MFTSSFFAVSLDADLSFRVYIDFSSSSDSSDSYSLVFLIITLLRAGLNFFVEEI